ncbi:endo-beta-N-acetylglucosaminidase [Spiroplasma endosymbiont of Diplazon laetatorius]|uniref:endo-beta-N-acetylglucosaminidase n=1 Tax=Spiroplasma endosymbiont of Diplazon laetatorius TaxID=3066322 RepID=UPI0030CBEE2C
MRKLIFCLLALTNTMPFLLYTVSCGSNIKDYGTDLSKIGDYNWKNEEPYYKGHSENNALEIPKVSLESNLKMNNERNFLDYKEFNTGYKTSSEVHKQSPTGVPLNSKFMPNGNRKKDIMSIKRNEIFDRTNSFLDWNFSSDLDAKYNKSRIELQKTTKVASKWVESQDPKIKEMNMSVLANHTSNENTIVGNHRTYYRSFNNYQYNDILVSWAGAADEGIIVPPAKNEVEKAHINGTKILGNIFLDGYHGLTRQMLTDFLKKDSAGQYLIVDILINLALELGFDGWFWNNEPNGYFYNGYILKYEIVEETMKQWNNKVKNSSDERVKDLILFSYKNDGTLELDSDGKPISKESIALKENSDYFQSDFGVTPNKSIKYLENQQKPIDSHEIYNMYNLGGWINGDIFYNENLIGKRDLRDLVYIHLDPEGKEYIDFETEKRDKNSNKWTYKEDESINSLSIFAGHTASDLAEREAKKLGNTQASDIYAMAKTNYYDDMVYTGHNRQLSESDYGSISYDTSTFEEGMSYGVGNLVQEKTLLNDENESFFTNFSTGNGAKFATLTGYTENGVVLRNVEENYPWTNTNIADAQPTYKWMVSEVEGDKENKVNSSEISGYYDYYEPFLKGNSIALGGGIDETNGQIKDAKFTSGKTYNWMIMGSNYKNKYLNVSFVYKSNDEELKPKILFEEVSSGEQKLQAMDGDIKDIGGGWREISSNIKSSNTIGKIGLQFQPNKDAKINVGQLSVNQNKINTNYNQNEINFNSELVIDRNNGYKNYRINFDNLIDSKDIYSYYELYYENEGKIYRVGETNSENLYLKDIPDSSKNIYIKVQNNASKKIEWIKLKVGE